MTLISLGIIIITLCFIVYGSVKLYGFHKHERFPVFNNMTDNAIIGIRWTLIVAISGIIGSFGGLLIGLFLEYCYLTHPFLWPVPWLTVIIIGSILYAKNLLWFCLRWFFVWSFWFVLLMLIYFEFFNNCVTHQLFGGLLIIAGVILLAKNEAVREQVNSFNEGLVDKKNLLIILAFIGVIAWNAYEISILHSNIRKVRKEALFDYTEYPDIVDLKYAFEHLEDRMDLAKIPKHPDYPNGYPIWEERKKTKRDPLIDYLIDKSM